MSQKTANMPVNMPLSMPSVIALLRVLVFGLLLAAGPAHAALTIEITGAGASQIPVAIVPFRAEEGLAQRITPVVEANLARSGLFRAVDAGGMNPVPHEPEQVNYAQWRARGADAVVIGSVAKAADGRYDIRFRVMDVAKQAQIAGFVYFASENQLRLTAHKIADVIYEKLTGEPGVFATRIAYVVKRGTRHELHVADADGFGAQSVLSSNEPIISPAWSPDGTRLAYVSFEQKKPVVYVQSLLSGGRQAVAAFRGSNSA
ncbi:MAG: PD40 domain-containing protein, partial [Burkholderiales bacterium]|nr:PD40 domain-containing protein [Burkholderiales bacterium]